MFSWIQVDRDLKGKKKECLCLRYCRFRCFPEFKWTGIWKERRRSVCAYVTADSDVFLNSSGQGFERKEEGVFVSTLLQFPYIFLNSSRQGFERKEEGVFVPTLLQIPICFWIHGVKSRDRTVNVMAEPGISKTGTGDAKPPRAIFGVQVTKTHVSVYTTLYTDRKVNYMKSWAI